MLQEVKIKKVNLDNKNISVRNLTVRYQGKIALRNINLDIRSHKITGVIGANGAGKSTFIKGIMGLINTESGTVEVGGNPLEKVRKNIAYVEQRSALDLSFPISVEEVVMLGMYPKLGLFHRPKQKEVDKVYEALEQVKMTEFADRQIGELSGGQLQRVFLARALVQEANVILLDEPFVGIDITSERLIIDLLKKIKKQGKSVVIVHHDLHKVVDYFDDLIILNKDLVAYGSVRKTFTTENIEKAYGNTMGDFLIKGVDRI